MCDLRDIFHYTTKSWTFFTWKRPQYILQEEKCSSLHNDVTHCRAEWLIVKGLNAHQKVSGAVNVNLWSWHIIIKMYSVPFWDSEASDNDRNNGKGLFLSSVGQLFSRIQGYQWLLTKQTQEKIGTKTAEAHWKWFNLLCPPTLFWPKHPFVANSVAYIKGKVNSKHKGLFALFAFSFIFSTREEQCKKEA